MKVPKTFILVNILDGSAAHVSYARKKMCKKKDVQEKRCARKKICKEKDVQGKICARIRMCKEKGALGKG